MDNLSNSANRNYAAVRLLDELDDRASIREKVAAGIKYGWDARGQFEFERAAAIRKINKPMPLFINGHEIGRAVAMNRVVGFDDGERWEIKMEEHNGPKAQLAGFDLTGDNPDFKAAAEAVIAETERVPYDRKPGDLTLPQIIENALRRAYAFGEDASLERPLIPKPQQPSPTAFTPETLTLYFVGADDHDGIDPIVWSISAAEPVKEPGERTFLNMSIGEAAVFSALCDIAQRRITKTKLAR